MSFLKALGSSTPLWFVLAGLVVVGMVLLVWPRTRRFAKHWLLWVTGVYVVFGVPVVANAIAGSLPAGSRVHRDGEPIHTLLVFDGDNLRGRLAETLRVLRTQSPRQTWIVGDEWLIEELQAAGYPRSAFGHDKSNATTREQVDWALRFASDRPDAKLTIVVSRLQLPRVAALIRAAGFEATLLPSPIDDEPPASGWRAWAPSYIGLRASRDAAYEHLALWWYQWKGWI